MKKLDNIRFARGRNLPNDALDQARKDVASHVDDFDVTPNVVSPERKEKIEKMLDCHANWAESELGLDVDSRRPILRKIRFLNRTGWEKISSIHNQGTGVLGLTNFGNNIFVLDEGDEDYVLAILNHELVHAHANKTVYASMESSNNMVVQVNGVTGYENTRTGAFHFFNEIMTDMLNLKIAQGSGYFNHEREQPSYYKNGLIFLDLLIESLAQKTGAKPADLWKEFYRAYYTGDLSILQKVAKVFGKDKLRDLADLKKNGYSDADIVGLALNFDLPLGFLLDQLSALNRGDEVMLRNGIKFKIK